MSFFFVILHAEINETVNMSNPSNYLRRLRPDLSPYLFHFTSGPTPIENMKSILSQRKLKSDRGYICLTDSPLSMLGEQFKYMDKFPRQMYSQYGIGFTRDVLIRGYGCRPVIYGDGDERKLIAASLMWRYEPLDIFTHDYTWLREWRIAGNEFDFSGINMSDIIVIAPTQEALDEITTDLDVDVEFAYDHSTKEAYPYPVYTIRRAWKGVPLSQAASYKDDNELQQIVADQKIGEEIK